MIRTNETKSPRSADEASHTKGRGWPQDVRLELARAVVDQRLSAYKVAARLGVPYTTAQQWVKRYREGGAAALTSAARGSTTQSQGSSQCARRAAILATKAAQPQAGTRRIRDVMKRFLGMGTSETTVRRVLQSEGMMQRRPAARAKPKPAPHHFERAEPNQLWQSDLFTFLLRRHERLYVAAFLDDHSRYLVSLARWLTISAALWCWRPWRAASPTTVHRVRFSPTKAASTPLGVARRSSRRSYAGTGFST